MKQTLRELLFFFLALAIVVFSGRSQTADAEQKQSRYKEMMRAEQGAAKVQFNLGNMYFEGKGVPQDYQEAAKWYRKAAEQGYVEAQRLFGDMHAAGKGIPQDDQEAVKWYHKAAEQGDAASQYNLGQNCTTTNARVFPRTTKKQPSGTARPLGKVMLHPNMPWESCAARAKGSLKTTEKQSSGFARLLDKVMLMPNIPWGTGTGMA